MSEKTKIQNRKEKLERLIKLQKTASSPKKVFTPEKKNNFKTDDSLDFI